MTKAYEALSPELKAQVEGLQAVQSYRYTYEKKATDFKLRPRLADRGGNWIPPDVVHPVDDSGAPCSLCWGLLLS